MLVNSAKSRGRLFNELSSMRAAGAVTLTTTHNSCCPTVMCAALSCPNRSATDVSHVIKSFYWISQSSTRLRSWDISSKPFCPVVHWLLVNRPNWPPYILEFVECRLNCERRFLYCFIYRHRLLFGSEMTLWSMQTLRLRVCKIKQNQNVKWVAAEIEERKGWLLKTIFQRSPPLM